MIEENLKYSYSDLSIIPAISSNINSRSECSPYKSNDIASNNLHLPIFTAPMQSVCDDSNYKLFEQNNIIPIIHRNVDYNKRIELTKRGVWCAYSIKEFKETFCDNFKIKPHYGYYLRVLIDVANGHMQQIFDLAIKAKQNIRYYNEKNITSFKLVLMAGNIANPKTYLNYCKAGIDYVRCSIGTGSQCLTSANSGIHYPNASLIDKIHFEKQDLEFRIENKTYKLKQNECVTKIIADGGMGNTEQAFSNINIALALGADYVMIGGAFSSFIESSAQFNNSFPDYNCPIKLKQYNDELSISLIYGDLNRNIIKEFENIFGDIPISNNRTRCKTIKISDLYNKEIADLLIKYVPMEKISFGMSTKEAQKNNPNFDGNFKTSEGKTISSPVKYTIQSWVENFKAYLTSAMSYCNCRTLEQFIGKQTLCIKSIGTLNSVNK